MNALGSNYVVPDRVAYQVRTCCDTQRLHHFVLVKGARPSRDVQDAANFLHQLSFGQQLQDFTFPLGQPPPLPRYVCPDDAGS